LKTKKGNLSIILVIIFILCIKVSRRKAFQVLKRPFLCCRADKHVETADKGLVLMSAVEADAGRYECRLGGSPATSPMSNTISSEMRAELGAAALDEEPREDPGALLCAFNLTVDAHRCNAPERSQDYIKVYADWCHQFNKFKTAMHLWEKRQAVSSAAKNYTFQSLSESSDPCFSEMNRPDLTRATILYILTQFVCIAVFFF